MERTPVHVLKSVALVFVVGFVLGVVELFVWPATPVAYFVLALAGIPLAFATSWVGFALAKREFDPAAQFLKEGKLHSPGLVWAARILAPIGIIEIGFLFSDRGRDLLAPYFYGI